MIEEITTKHIQNSGRLYFFPKEKVALVIASIFILILSSVLFTFQAFIELNILLCVFLIPTILFGVLPAYQRAEFLARGNYYRVMDGVLESRDGGSQVRFSYKGKTVKCIQRRGSVVDIIIGENVQDFFKFFGSSEKSKIAICGVTNGDEVLEYLNLHK